MPVTRSNVNQEPTLADVLFAVNNNGDELREFKNEYNIQQVAISKDVEEIKKDNKAISKKANEFDSRLTSMQFEVETLKQKQLKNNLCIGGIPRTADENLLDIVINIFCKLGILNDIHDFISGVYRTKGKSSAIIVNLSNEGLKSEILLKKRLRRYYCWKNWTLNWTQPTLKLP